MVTLLWSFLYLLVLGLFYAFCQHNDIAILRSTNSSDVVLLAIIISGIWPISAPIMIGYYIRKGIIKRISFWRKL